MQVQLLNLSSRPRRLAEKLEARLDAGILFETPNADSFAQFVPAISFEQMFNNCGECHAVQWIVGLVMLHSIRAGNSGIRHEFNSNFIARIS